MPFLDRVIDNADNATHACPRGESQRKYLIKTLDQVQTFKVPAQLTLVEKFPTCQASPC
jgi:hypothetical protein